jgi:hypothetical protein
MTTNPKLILKKSEQNWLKIDLPSSKWQKMKRNRKTKNIKMIELNSEKCTTRCDKRRCSR